MRTGRNWKQTLSSATAILLYIALFKLLLHFVAAGQYGYHRDELYYLAASQHLDFGYVDFPPFIAALTALIRATLGDSLLAIHAVPALAGATLVVIAGLMARQLGGGKWTQVAAALAVAVAPTYLGVNSLLSMDTFDELFWVLALYVVIVILKHDRPKLWLLFGFFVGLGLLTKVTILYMVAALVIGLLLTRQRRYLLSKWLWLGGVLALVMFSPYIYWQIAHGWPTLEFWRIYASSKTYPVTPIEFLVQQIVMLNPLTLPLWVAGLVFFFTRAGKTYRTLGWTYAILYVVLTVQQAKFYFLAPTYPMLFAAGAVWWSGLLRQRGRWAVPVYLVALTVVGLVTAPLALPLLPVETIARYVNPTVTAQQERLEIGVLPQHFADRFGWPELAATVAEVYRALPPEEQARACIVGDNYGEAGAIDFFGGALGLPKAISEHNSYYLWGPGDCSCETVIVIEDQDTAAEDMQLVFAEVELATTIACTYCMPYEDNRPIFVCRGLKEDIMMSWKRNKQFN